MLSGDGSGKSYALWKRSDWRSGGTWLLLSMLSGKPEGLLEISLPHFSKHNWYTFLRMKNPWPAQFPRESAHWSTTGLQGDSHLLLSGACTRGGWHSVDWHGRRHAAWGPAVSLHRNWSDCLMSVNQVVLNRASHVMLGWMLRIFSFFKMGVSVAQPGLEFLVSVSWVAGTLTTPSLPFMGENTFDSSLGMGVNYFST